MRTPEARQEAVSWRDQTESFQRKVKMPKNSFPWQERAGDDLKLLVPTARARALLDCAFWDVTHSAHQEGLAQLVTKLVADTSQSVARKPWSLKFPTLTTSSDLYIFARQSPMLMSERFHLLGYGRPRLGELSEGALKDLSGEAMFLPSVTACMQAMMLHLPYEGLWETGT